jgi:DNA-binding NtrC family response regulator
VIEIFAESEAMRAADGLARRVSPTDTNVLITGESGTGKDTLALFIHSQSQRATCPYVKIDCATLPRELLEAELFGYERGAFTSATEAKPGRLESAHRGTLVLDEIAHLSIDSQAKLLRVIETRQFERLGGQRTITVDARVIALTNVNLKEAISRRNFREDLYYRLNVVQIEVPALRNRMADLPQLAQHLLSGHAAKHGRAVTNVAPTALALLRDYEFPGNVRELSNILERALIVSSGSVLQIGDLPETVQSAVQSRRLRSKRQTLAELEAAYLKDTLAATKGNKTEAARILGISRKNLYERLARMDKAEG